MKFKENTIWRRKKVNLLYSVLTIPCTRRQPVAPGATNPYLPQLYAAAPYSVASPNIMQLMGGHGAGGVTSTGNPLLDMYAGQYMSKVQAAQGYQVYTKLNHWKNQTSAQGLTRPASGPSHPAPWRDESLH